MIYIRNNNQQSLNEVFFYFNLFILFVKNDIHFYRDVGVYFERSPFCSYFIFFLSLSFKDCHYFYILNNFLWFFDFKQSKSSNSNGYHKSFFFSKDLWGNISHYYMTTNIINSVLWNILQYLLKYPQKFVSSSAWSIDLLLSLQIHVF